MPVGPLVVIDAITYGNFFFQVIFFMVLMMYSAFVLTSISTEYYVQGPARFFEYFVYIWIFGDLLEELLNYLVSFVLHKILI